MRIFSLNTTEGAAGRSTPRRPQPTGADAPQQGGSQQIRLGPGDALKLIPVNGKRVRPIFREGAGIRTGQDQCDAQTERGQERGGRPDQGHRIMGRAPQGAQGGVLARLAGPHAGHARKIKARLRANAASPHEQTAPCETQRHADCRTAQAKARGFPHRGDEQKTIPFVKKFDKLTRRPVCLRGGDRARAGAPPARRRNDGNGVKATGMHDLFPSFPANNTATPCRLDARDAPAVAALERLCFTLPWTEEQFRQAFEHTAFAVSGIHEDGELVAYLSVYHTPDELEILNIAVRADRRRRGHGASLLGRALREAEKNGIRKAVLEVRPSNAPALGLYEKLGFTLAGRRRGYYPDTGEDALIYVRSSAPDA